MTKKINYLFCINTGRSGSHYLSSIFDHVENCVSEHEMKPIGHSQEMRQFLEGNQEPMEKLSMQRLELIKEKCSLGQTFIETSHLFIKGFGWFFAENIPNEEIGVIVLRREKNKVVDSFERIGCVPLEHRGRNWINTPAMKNTLIEAPKLPPFSPQISYSIMQWLSSKTKKVTSFIKKLGISKLIYLNFFSQYNRRCLEWYYDETYAQAEAFQNKFPNIRFYQANLEDLNDSEKIKELLNHFHLEIPANLNTLIGKPTNLKRH